LLLGGISLLRIRFVTSVLFSVTRPLFSEMILTKDRISKVYSYHLLLWRKFLWEIWKNNILGFFK